MTALVVQQVSRLLCTHWKYGSCLRPDGNNHLLGIGIIVDRVAPVIRAHVNRDDDSSTDLKTLCEDDSLCSYSACDSNRPLVATARLEETRLS